MGDENRSALISLMIILALIPTATLALSPSIYLAMTVGTCSILELILTIHSHPAHPDSNCRHIQRQKIPIIRNEPLFFGRMIVEEIPLFSRKGLVQLHFHE